jgi:hypothetical protein
MSRIPDGLTRSETLDLLAERALALSDVMPGDELFAGRDDVAEQIRFVERFHDLNEVLHKVRCDLLLAAVSLSAKSSDLHTPDNDLLTELMITRVAWEQSEQATAVMLAEEIEAIESAD